MSETGNETKAVGYKHPPKQHQFKPGQSGNPKGRPKASFSAKTIVERVAREPISIRQGEKTRTMPLLQAVILAQARNGAKGDPRGANALFSVMKLTGALTDPEEKNVVGGPPALLPSHALRPSETLFEGIEPDALTHNEQVELSRLANTIDLGGDFTAISNSDFTRLKLLINKRRGKDVTPLQ
jgi:hypothetical protein